MKKLLSVVAFAASSLAGVTAHAGEIALFTDDNFRGPSVTLRDTVPDLVRRGFNDRTSSVVVRSGTWEVCEHANFGGQCRVLERGEYRRLEGFNDEISSVREIQDRGHDRGDRDGRGGGGGGRGDRRDESVTMFEQGDFRGRKVELDRDIRTLNDVGFNDRAGSIIIKDGVWEVCEDADYRGRCMTLRPGRYDHLDRMNNSISSLRRVR
jgi:hypothetical protein